MLKISLMGFTAACMAAGTHLPCKASSGVGTKTVVIEGKLTYYSIGIQKKKQEERVARVLTVTKDGP